MRSLVQPVSELVFYRLESSHSLVPAQLAFLVLPDCISELAERSHKSSYGNQHYADRIGLQHSPEALERTAQLGKAASQDACHTCELRTRASKGNTHLLERIHDRIGIVSYIVLIVAYTLVHRVHLPLDLVDFLAQGRTLRLVSSRFPLLFQLSQLSIQGVKAPFCVRSVLLAGVHHLGQMPLHHVDFLGLLGVVLAFQLQAADFLS